MEKILAEYEEAKARICEIESAVALWKKILEKGLVDDFSPEGVNKGLEVLSVVLREEGFDLNKVVKNFNESAENRLCPTFLEVREGSIQRESGCLSCADARRVVKIIFGI